jgi:chromosome segregation ATPase
LRDDELDSLKCQLEQLEEKRIGLEAQVENLRQEKEVHALQISQLTQQLVGREHALEKSRERASQLEREMAEHRREEDANEGSEELISELKSENAELKESLEAESTTRASLEAKAKVLEKSVSDGGKIAEAEVQSARQQVTSLREEVDRKDKELMRLKEHLLQIEELSTREAILAEERETELRKELRFLQETSSTYTSSAAKSENSYKVPYHSLEVIPPAP